jgi:glucosylglycerate synthase
MELDSLPQPALEQIERLQGADLMVGILQPGGSNGQQDAAAAIVRKALETFPQPPRAVVVVDGAGETQSQEEQSFPVLFYKLSDAASPVASPQGFFDAYQTVFGIGGKIGVKACAVIASDLQTVTPLWIDRLVRPALESDFDLVAPRYARHKWEGLINRSVLSPLYRSLYGKRIQSPMGPDFGLSGKLMKAMLEEQAGTRGASPGYPVASVLSTAARSGFQVCEAEVGERRQPPTDWMNLSSLIAQILKSAFLDMERNAALWQRVRGSQLVPTFGAGEPAPEESGPVDAGRLIDSFQLGAKNLQDLWSLVLPPTMVLDLRKLARQPAPQFRMSDEVWVSIVYDFALAHRVRAINREHLLRSFTPLYLGWIASYALEMGTGGPFEVEARLERLARAFEAGKPYLLSRWRWPDRFNP